ncbi:MAG: 4-amino-4-deoxychorismate lyase [Symploca sp. SIO1A3]|nr:4-amino-4-deoxychorismate lyase [Symploca sp. SIO1A3]
MFWYNGQLIQGNSLELAIDDPGLLYGATVFTTLRVYHQSLAHPLTNWRGHCDRLWSSLQAFGWQLPEQQRLQQGAETLLPSFPVLRMAVFPDGREWITGRYLPKDLTQRQQQGVTAWLADTPELLRSLPTHKTGNYLTAWLALQQARQQGAQEAILADARGNCLETSTGNLWGWQEGCWWTPPLAAGILPGTARSQLMSWLQKQGLVVREAVWNQELLLGFKAIAYTNSVIEIIPIHTILTPHQNLTYESSHPSLEQLRSFFRF